MTPETCVKTTVSRMYDILLFAEFPLKNYSYSSDLRNVHYANILTNILSIENRYNNGGLIFMKALPTSWTQGFSADGNNNYISGPYIEYGYAPSTVTVYRLNGLTFERYRSKWSSDNSDYQLLMRRNYKYLVYGIDLEDHLAAAFANGYRP